MLDEDKSKEQLIRELHELRKRVAQFEKNQEERRFVDEELQILLEQRQLALDAANLGWWHYDPVTKITSYDQRYREIFDVTGSQRLNDEILNLLHPDDLSEVWSKVEAALDPVNPKPYSAQYRILRSDKSIRWVEAHGIATFEGKGETRYATGLVGTVQDITERKHASKELETTIIKYRTLFEYFPLGITVSDQQGNIIESNLEAEILLGFSAEEHLQRNIEGAEWKIVRPDGTPMPADEFASVRALREQRLISNVEMGIVKPTGEMTWISVTAAPIPPPSYGVVITYGDITARKQAEEALSKSERLHRELAKTLETERGTLQAIIDSLPVGLWIADAEGRIISVNDIGHAIWRGAPLPESVKDYTVYKAWWADTGKPIIAEEMPMARSLRGETCKNMAVNIERFDGTRGTQMMSSAPIKTSAGAITGCVAIAQDITELKRAEEALRKAREELEVRVRERTAELEEANRILRDKERALRSLSNRILSAHEEERKRISRELHDSISSSLTAIKLGLENYLSQAQELLGPLSNSAKIFVVSLAETMDEIRRIMSDLRPSVLDDLGLVPAIEWFCRKFRTTYPNIHIEQLLEINQQRIPEPLKIVVFRIIQEALQNIAKHSHAEFVDLILREKTGQVELFIEDNGIGFDPEAILAKAERGLGLSTMQERTELSGGSFEIKSIAGKGTAIRSLWPFD